MPIPVQGGRSVSRADTTTEARDLRPLPEAGMEDALSDEAHT